MTSGQLRLDGLPDVTVWWILGEMVQERRKGLAGLLGKKATRVQLLPPKGDNLLADVRYLDAGDINEENIHDSQLRYALRHQAVAEIDDTVPDVVIVASDDGPDSSLIDVTYYGREGAFEDALRNGNL